MRCALRRGGQGQEPSGSVLHRPDTHDAKAVLPDTDAQPDALALEPPALPSDGDSAGVGRRRPGTGIAWLGRSSAGRRRRRRRARSRRGPVPRCRALVPTAAALKTAAAHQTGAAHQTAAALQTAPTPRTGKARPGPSTPAARVLRPVTGATHALARKARGSAARSSVRRPRMRRPTTRHHRMPGRPSCAAH